MVDERVEKSRTGRIGVMASMERGVMNAYMVAKRLERMAAFEHQEEG